MGKDKDIIELREPSRDGVHDGKLQAKVNFTDRAIEIRDSHERIDYKYFLNPKDHTYTVVAHHIDSGTSGVRG